MYKLVLPACPKPPLHNTIFFLSNSFIHFISLYRFPVFTLFLYFLFFFFFFASQVNQTHNFNFTPFFSISSSSSISILSRFFLPISPIFISSSSSLPSLHTHNTILIYNLHFIYSVRTHPFLVLFYFYSFSHLLLPLHLLSILSFDDLSNGRVSLGLPCFVFGSFLGF